MKIADLLGKIDRRIIFIVLTVVIVIPLISPIGFVGRLSPRVHDLFKAIDELKPSNKPLLISVDFDPQSMPELYPMLVSILRHSFARNVRVIVMGLWVTGVGLGEEALTTVGQEYKKEYGKDYVFLGWKPGVSAVVLGMGRSIKETFSTDYYGKPIDSFPMMAGVNNYRDIPLLVTLSAGDPGFNTVWLPYAQARFGVRVGTGVTAVSAADAYPYLQTGQLVGLIDGMKGASEYELLVEKAGYSEAFKPASQAMDSQSLAHLAIMILIVLGNVGYFLARKRRT
ncbi:MAG: hypothetical protein ACETVX_00755 [bacterium]